MNIGCVNLLECTYLYICFFGLGPPLVEPLACYAAALLTQPHMLPAVWTLRVSFSGTYISAKWYYVDRLDG